MESSALFVGWLRGFLDGVGDRDLTKKQVKRIILEAEALLDPSEESSSEAPVKTKQKALSRAQLLALGKNSGNGDPPPPGGLGDIPTVERQG